jgi:hypothetical protein
VVSSLRLTIVTVMASTAHTRLTRRPGIAAIGPDHSDREEPLIQQGQQPTRRIAIPDRGSNDDHSQPQPNVSTRDAACGVLIFFPPSKPIAPLTWHAAAEVRNRSRA